MTSPTCFISYSWDSDEHKAWVRHLAIELQRNGVKTNLDQWDIHPGIDFIQYMETSIREADFVLLVCTPDFTRKANIGRGGVGYEKGIVTGEIFEGSASPEKFVPLLRKGMPKDSLPSYLKSRLYIDLRDDYKFDLCIESLLRHIHQEPEYIRPPLGKKPDLPHREDSQNKINGKPIKMPNLATFEQAYQFAYSYSGMNKDRQGAEAFAQLWLEKFFNKDFELFKQAYQFAYSYSGMNKDRQGAEAFAQLWLEKFFNKDFEVFKQAYQFAYSYNGMNKDRQGAEAFAFEQLSKS